MAKKNLERFNVLSLALGLKKVKLTGHIFTYKVTHNKLEIATEVKAINATIKPLQEFEEYKKALEELNISFSRKDNVGTPKKFQITPGQWMYDLPGYGNPVSDYEKAVVVLKEKHKDAIEKQTKKGLEDEKFLSEKVDINLMLVRIDQVPNDVSQDVMDGLFFMIKKPTDKELE